MIYRSLFPFFLNLLKMQVYYVAPRNHQKNNEVIKFCCHLTFRNFSPNKLLSCFLLPCLLYVHTYRDLYEYGLITPWFFIMWLAPGCMKAQCGHNNEPSLDQKVPNERYGYALSIGTLESKFEQVVGSQWSGKVGCFLVFFMIPSGAGNLHSNPDFQSHTVQRWSGAT